jgi:hypothetical protein
VSLRSTIFARRRSVPTNKDFEDLFACFAAEGVKALIVGGYAVAFHAKPRTTKDIDVWVEPTADNASRVMAALARFGFGDVGLAADDFARPGQIVQLGYPPNRIDLLTSIAGVEFGEAWARRVPSSYGKAAVCYIGLDDLIRNKEAVRRPTDLADARWLRKARR